MNKWTWALVFACGLAVGGCDKKEEAKPAAPAPAAPAAPAGEAPAAPTGAAPTGAAPAAPAGDAKAAEQAAKALGDALGAAAKAEGATPCEKAYNGMEAMMKAMEKNMPAGAKSSGKGLPPKDQFVGACKELPPTVQSCMTMDYAMAHQKECQEAQAKLDPAVMAKFKSLMGGK